MLAVYKIMGIMRTLLKYLGLATLVCVAACTHTEVGGESDAGYTVSVQKVTPELLTSMYELRAQDQVPAPEASHIDEEVYKVGPGDVLFVKLTALSARTNQNGDGVLFLTGLTSMPARQIGQEVTREGIIEVPVIGRVYAQGKTVRQLSDEITNRMLTLYKHPTVEVKVLEYNTHLASITGEVNVPKRVPLDSHPVHVLDLVTLAGGVRETADLRNATLTRADGAVVPLDLAALLLKGDNRYNVLIKPDDILNIPGNHLNKLFVFGEAVRPLQQFMRQDGKSLAEVLNELNPNEITHSNQVYVIRGAASDEAIDAAAKDAEHAGSYASVLGKVDIFDVSLDTLAGYALADKFVLQPRDIVYLAESRITSWNRFISQLLPGSVTSAVSAGSSVRTASE